MLFFDIHISQGSVATHLKRDGISKQEFVANFLVEFITEKSLIIG